MIFKNYPKWIFCLLLLLFTFGKNSCTQKEKSKEETEGLPESKAINLAIVDSIQIPFLGNPMVQDISPIQQRIVFMDQKEYSEDIFVADFEGNILATLSKLS